MSNNSFKNCNHIPEAGVDQDILDTRREIIDYTDELVVLERNPPENKMRIFMLRARIAKREIFITKLLDLLSWRKDNENNSMFPK